MEENRKRIIMDSEKAWKKTYEFNGFHAFDEIENAIDPCHCADFESNIL